MSYRVMVFAFSLVLSVLTFALPGVAQEAVRQVEHEQPESTDIVPVGWSIGAGLHYYYAGSGSIDSGYPLTWSSDPDHYYPSYPDFGGFMPSFLAEYRASAHWAISFIVDGYFDSGARNSHGGPDDAEQAEEREHRYWQMGLSPGARYIFNPQSPVEASLNMLLVGERGRATTDEIDVDVGDGEAEGEDRIEETSRSSEYWSISAGFELVGEYRLMQHLWLRLGLRLFRVRYRVYSGTNVRTLADETERYFTDSDGVALHFIDWPTLHLRLSF